MTKKHFEIIADILANCIVASSNPNNKKSLTDLFMDGLENTNIKFNRQKFLNAVYVKVESLLKKS